MDTNSGNHTLGVHSMPLPSYGSFNNSTDRYLTRNMVWKGGRLARLPPRLDNFITITSMLLVRKHRPNNTNIYLIFIHLPPISLRTSETNYLNEAFSFYSAIRARGYYSKASKEERAELMVKKLRYYARFIVVCLLLKKMKVVRDLVRVRSIIFTPVIMIYFPIWSINPIICMLTGVGQTDRRLYDDIRSWRSTWMVSCVERN